MQMTTIIRLESEPQKGIYTGLSKSKYGVREVLERWALEVGSFDLTHGGKHPSPYDDRLLGFGDMVFGYEEVRKYFFGFLDKEQLFGWFYDKNVLLELAVLDVELVTYTVPRPALRVGMRQVASPLMYLHPQYVNERKNLFEFLTENI